MGVRPAHVAGAAAASLALLLLLSYYGADSPPPPAQRRLQLARLAAGAPQPLARLNLTSAAADNATDAAPPPPPPPPAAPQRNRTTRAPPPPPPPRAEPADPRLLMTRAVYVAGHSAPHPELCPALGERLRLMIFVTSAPAHAEARAAVRLTWGHFAARADVSLAFLVGATRDAAAQAALAAEDALYGDVVRANFVDSYSNLTLKTISMLEWADNYCPRARRLLKTDDDMFVNVPRLLAFAERRAADTRTIYGKVVRKSAPKRTTKSKYYVSPLQFAGKVFPDFATGPAYLLTGDCVRPLYARALTQPYVRLEDVYVTGVIAAQLNISRVHSPEFYNKKVSAHPCNVQRGISIHMVRYHEQFDLWRKLLDGKSKCAKT